MAKKRKPPPLGAGIDDAASPAAPPPAVSGDDSPAWAQRLLRSETGAPKATVGNMLLIFEHDLNWSGALGYNERTQQVVFRHRPPPDILAAEGEPFADTHATQATIWLQSAYGFGLKGTGTVYTAMIAASQLHRFDPVKEYLDALPAWDGQPRMNNWLIDAAGCDSTVYTQAVSSSFMIGAVARVYCPGAKVDTVLVLQGEQGVMKSTMLRELAIRDEWFTDHVSDIGGKDAALQLCGPWILEIAEMDGITGKRENERVKSWITQQRDRFRPPYGRAVVDVPRRVVFAASSNLDQFLRDETGGRRFLPVRIKNIDMGAVRDLREQWWAEAKARYLAGEKWWLEGDALTEAKIEQEDRRIADPWEDEISQWIAKTAVNPTAGSTHNVHGRRIFTTSNEVLTDALEIEPGRMTKSDQDRVGRVLRSLGWRRNTQRIDRQVRKVWLPPLEGEGEVVEIQTKASAAAEIAEKEQVGFEW